MAAHEHEKELQKELMHSISRLTDGVVHQFNNQLTVIQGYSDMLLRQLSQENPAREAVEEIDRAARKASNMTSRLLAFSGRQVLHPRVVNLNDFINGMTPALSFMLGEDIELSCPPCPDDLNVRVDPQGLETNLLSVLTNAAEAMPNGGRITIDLARTEDAGEKFARIRITDTGAGMDEESTRHAFQPFYSTKAPGREAGLGLAVLYGFIRQSQGQVDLSSTPGQGTSVTLRLPLAEPVDLPYYDQSPALPACGNETILICMESGIMRQFMSQSLRNFGYNVHVAASFAEAGIEAMRIQGSLHMLIQDSTGHHYGGDLPPLIGPRAETKILYARTRFERHPSAPEEAVIPWTHRISALFGSSTLTQAVRRLLETPVEQPKRHQAILTGKGSAKSGASGLGQWFSDQEDIEKQLTEEEWNRIRPHLPKKRSSRKGGRKLIDDRLILEGIVWVMRYDRRWEDLPEAYPSARTCRRRLQKWKSTGIWEKIRPIVMGQTTGVQQDRQ
jgi:transposase